MIYIVYFCEKLTAMETTLETKRKVIDISADTFRALSVMAASKGTNLKKMIEGILDLVAEDFEANDQYSWLLKELPEGKEMASEKEKKDFEDWLGV